MDLTNYICKTADSTIYDEEGNIIESYNFQDNIKKRGKYVNNFKKDRKN